MAWATFFLSWKKRSRGLVLEVQNHHDSCARRSRGFPRWVGQSLGHHESTHGHGAEPELGLLDLLGLGSTRTESHFCHFLDNCYLDERLKPIKKMSNIWPTSEGWPAGLQAGLGQYLLKHSPLSTTRRLWSPLAFEGSLCIPLVSGFCVSLCLQPLGSLSATLEHTIPHHGPNRKKKWSFLQKSKSMLNVYFKNGHFMVILSNYHKTYKSFHKKKRGVFDSLDSFQ